MEAMDGVTFTRGCVTFTRGRQRPGRGEAFPPAYKEEGTGDCRVCGVLGTLSLVPRTHIDKPDVTEPGLVWCIFLPSTETAETWGWLVSRPS